MKLEELQRQRAAILRLAAAHGAHNVQVFGSVARGEATGVSDVDLLVDLEPGRSLLDLGGLLSDLQAALACDVDVATRAMLKGRVRERVLREAVPL